MTIPDARLAEVNPIDNPRRCSGKTDAAMAGAVLYRQPVPSACSTLNPTSDSSVGDSDMHTMDTRYVNVPNRYTIRSPKRSANAPAPNANPARVAMNTTITHCTAARSVPNASRIAGNPTLTAKSSDASTIPSADAAASATVRQVTRTPSAAVDSGAAAMAPDCTPKPTRDGVGL